MKTPRPIPFSSPWFSLELIVLLFFIFDSQVNAIGGIERPLILSEQDTLPPDALNSNLPSEIEKFINNEIEFKVPVMTCQQLHELKDNGRKKLAILDARSQKEFDVSHIEDARRVGYDDFSSERVWFVDKETIVVIYCRVGQKSEHIGLELKKMGFKEIYNLYGSIIEWVNQELPVINKEGKPTKKVFTHNRKEKNLLKHKSRKHNEKVGTSN